MMDKKLSRDLSAAGPNPTSGKKGIVRSTIGKPRALLPFDEFISIFPSIIMSLLVRLGASSHSGIHTFYEIRVNERSC